MTTQHKVVYCVGLGLAFFTDFINRKESFPLKNIQLISAQAPDNISVD